MCKPMTMQTMVRLPEEYPGLTFIKGLNNLLSKHIEYEAKSCIDCWLAQKNPSIKINASSIKAPDRKW